MRFTDLYFSRLAIRTKSQDIGKIRHKGFTLIEMLVVIVIMGLLVGLIGPQVVGQADKAKVTTAKTQMATIKAALDMYKLDNNFYPTTDQG